MNTHQQQVEDISIEWFKRNKDRFIVKFDSIDIPIEMNKTYFECVKKHLHI